MAHFISSSDEITSRPNGKTGRERGAMRNRRRKTGAGTARSMSAQLLGLSLFIMLLAFFIVLNAISSYEETKVRPIMDSLGEVFSSRLQEDERVEESPSVTEDESKSINEGSALDKMQALFKSQIPSHEAVVSNRKGVMYVKVPFDDFEEAILAVGQPSKVKKQEEGEQAQFLKGFFLPTLISLVDMDTGNIPYRMDIVLNVNENPARLQNRRPKKLAALMKKMGRIASKIEDAGLPTKLVSVGLQKGEEDMVEIIFRRHIAFNPLGPDENEQ